ncbi:MAG: MBOAT family protein [Tepidisphaeraceae bacterium]|jgi:alginate O-acetyltransferase complex protein AlgI
MLFTDPCFLFLLLPVVLTVYYCTPRAGKNYVLLAGSLVFYALGEGWSTFVVVASIAINFYIGTLIAAAPDRKAARGAMVLGVIVNLTILCVFKYAAFVVRNINVPLVAIGIHQLPLPKIHLPLGISFFTFHALSYIIDVFRKEVKPLKRSSIFGLYIMLFPQLIAGPIIRYKTICDQFTIGGPRGRQHSWDSFSEGVRRFIIGFGKKMLIANTVAQTADTIFTVRPYLITSAVAWLGVLCYTLQIYFDFSGYSDMAIGLGKMFGFTFPENFNYPYIATSITDFWHRWHITLSSWFRDYLYIPLGGNRVPKWRVYANLLTVFFLCGLWHGATWTFVVWGLFHGAFLIIERAGLGKWLERHRAVRHVYTLLVVMVGWVFFRSDTFAGAGQYLTRMAFLGSSSSAFFTLSQCVNRALILALAAGVIGSLPIVPLLGSAFDRAVAAADGARSRLVDLTAGMGEFAALSAIFLASTALSAAGTYNPFIYFHF